MRPFAVGLVVMGLLVAGSPVKAEPAAAVAPAPAATAAAPVASAGASDPWRIRPDGWMTVDGGLVLGFPVALGTGLSTGVGGGAMLRVGRFFSWGGRASWSTATESSIAWTVTHADVRLRAAAAIEYPAGRGRFGLRLGAGPTIIHESRVRNQGMRAGLTGSDLETATFTTLPTADLEAVVSLHILGPWLLAISGGPSLTILDGGAHAGFTALIGMGWQP
jgi:hypothetical protein